MTTPTPDDSDVVTVQITTTTSAELTDDQVHTVGTAIARAARGDLVLTSNADHPLTYSWHLGVRGAALLEAAQRAVDGLGDGLRDHAPGVTHDGPSEIRVRTADAVRRSVENPPRRVDLVDGDTFAELLGVGRSRFYAIRQEGHPDFPAEVHRGIWLGAPARRFAHDYRARVGSPARSGPPERLVTAAGVYMCGCGDAHPLGSDCPGSRVAPTTTGPETTR